MSSSIMMLLAIFFPIVLGIAILLMPVFSSPKCLLGAVGAGLVITGVLAFGVLLGENAEALLFTMGDNLNLYFRLDFMGRLFLVPVIVIWILVGFYSFEYMKLKAEQKQYFGFYMMAFGALLALTFAGNMVTFYLFYEMMTLLPLPLVLHDRTREALMGGLKYLFYSLCGAYMALMGLFFLNQYTDTLNFTAGGTLNKALVAGNEKTLLIVAFFMILGFSVKAGMFPMHAWLPLAHPVAPAPASAVLSGLIVKAGVLGIVRAVYFLFGASFLKETWVQTAWLSLSLFTIFMGSMLAYREKELKKRLAYSTVSQVSYILFGLALLQPHAMTGALLHVVFHALIKSALFLAAGAIIYQTGKTNVDNMKGIGKEMPIIIWCYTLSSLALIGIPPASGFISKWHLAMGSLLSDTGIFRWLGSVVLLLSALLTAGYLLPVTIKGFLPGDNFDYAALQKKEPNLWMLIPLFILAMLAIVLGIFPNPLTSYIEEITAQLL